MIDDGGRRHIGFTGTRGGMSKGQREALQTILMGAAHSRAHTGVVLHHGDCVGADAEAHEVAQSLGLAVVIHPPTNPQARAYCKGAERWHRELDYLVRNHEIVRCSDYLIAAPGCGEKLRSGTWATVRYARKTGDRILILEREGTGVRYIGGPEQDPDEREGK